MANYKTNRKQISVFLSEEAINVYKKLQNSGIRVAVLIENFLLDLGKDEKNKVKENE